MLNIYFHEHARIAEGQRHQRCDPFLIIPPLYLFPWKEASCHHISLLSSITQNSSWRCSHCYLPFLCHPLSASPPLSAASEGCPSYFYPGITDAFVSLLLPSSGSFLVSPLPWECPISSDTPNWSLITKRTGHAINFINYYFYACNNRPVLHTLKIWPRCFSCKYFWVTQGLTWRRSTWLPKFLLPTHHVIQAHSNKGFSEPTPEACPFISKGNSDSCLSQHRKVWWTRAKDLQN